MIYNFSVAEIPLKFLILTNDIPHITSALCKDMDRQVFWSAQKSLSRFLFFSHQLGAKVPMQIKTTVNSMAWKAIYPN